MRHQKALAAALVLTKARFGAAMALITQAQNACTRLSKLSARVYLRQQ